MSWSKRHRFALGIDLGGTSVRAGIVNETGTVCGGLYDRAREGTNVDELMQEVRAHADWAAARNDTPFTAVGLAVAGGIDRATGTIGSSPTAPDLVGLDSLHIVLGDDLATVANDADAAMFGEWRYGAATGTQHCLGFMLGTGLGGAAIINGVPLSGFAGLAGEFGHLVVDPDGHHCPCGGVGCLEQYASGPSLVRDYRTQATKSVADITPTSIAALARNGDPTAIACFVKLGDRLGIAVAGLANVFNPQRVIIGGGLTPTADLFLPSTRAAVDRHAMPMTKKYLTLTIGALGRAAGVIGAATLAGER